MGLHLAMYLWARRRPLPPLALRAFSLLLMLSAGWISISLVTSVNRFANLLPPGEWLRWLRGMGLLWGLAFTGVSAVFLIVRALKLEQRFKPERRQFLQAAQTAAIASPAILTGYGVYAARNGFQVKEVDLAVPGLAKDLQGLRLVQLSDIHMSAFLTAPELRRVVDMANETKAHLALVTGDLVTGPHDPLEACLVELKRLRAEAGIYGCMGNHEIFAACEDRAEALARGFGMKFLRRASEPLRFGDATFNLAGVDYQPFSLPYLVGAEELVKPGMLNILLSHNPDVFPVAAAKGFDITLAGHTHGGQVTVEYLQQHVNVARFFTPYVLGKYEKGNSSLYVTRGIGTVGIPARIGAPPEITLIRLCAA